MGYLAGFLVTAKQHRLFGGKRVTTSYSGGRVAKKGNDTEGRDEITAMCEHGRPSIPVTAEVRACPVATSP